mmetsp:Transcript_35623/g.82786  ORF Transcript_35623/g.82786 Transcript_35623/m.82786 type:complete len:158 (-) Transcript_35623:511-984(-)
MIKMIKPFPNYFLIAWNQNFDLNLWVTEVASESLFGSKILCGHVKLLKELNSQARTGQKILLETRLDADDGLHYNHLRNIQYAAVDILLPTDSSFVDNSTRDWKLEKSTGEDLQWVYWCSQSYIEWYSRDASVGTLKIEKPVICITPGLSESSFSYA